MEIDYESGLPESTIMPTDFQNLQQMHNVNDEYGVNIDEHNDRCEGDAEYEHENDGDYESDNDDDEEYDNDNYDNDEYDNDEYEEDLTSPASEHLDEEDEDIEKIVDEDGKSFKGFQGEYGPYFQNFTSTILFLWTSKHMICKYACIEMTFSSIYSISSYCCNSHRSIQRFSKHLETSSLQYTRCYKECLAVKRLENTSSPSTNPLSYSGNFNKTHTFDFNTRKASLYLLPA